MKLSHEEQDNLNLQFMISAQNGDIAKLEDCLAQGAHLNCVDVEDLDASHFAVQNGHVEMYEHLVQKADFIKDRLDGNGNGHVMLAAWGDHLDMVKHLVENHSVDLVRSNNFGVSAEACCPDNSEMLAYVQGVKANNSELLDSAKEGNIERFEECLTKAAQLNCRDDEGLDASHWAAYSGHVEMYDHVVGREGFIKDRSDNNGNNAVTLAVFESHFEMIKHLVENHSADLEHQNNFEESAKIIAEGAALAQVSKYVSNSLSEEEQNDHNLKIGISRYINEVVSSNHDLSKAAFSGNFEEFEQALAKGAQLNVKNSDGLNAALLAVEGGHYDMYCNIIAREGFVPVNKDKYGNDAALLAAWRENVDVYNKLVDNHGCDPKAVNDYGFNVANIAASTGSVDMIKNIAIRYSSVDLDHKNSNGDSSFDLASQGKHYAFIKELGNILDVQQVLPPEPPSSSQVQPTAVEQLDNFGKQKKR